MISQGLIDSLKKLSREANGKEYTDEKAKEAADLSQTLLMWNGDNFNYFSLKIELSPNLS
ncbi:MAG: hypothetical protein AAB662_04785 [Patescibacteria group bacterium]